LTAAFSNFGESFLGRHPKPCYGLVTLT